MPTNADGGVIGRRPPACRASRSCSTRLPGSAAAATARARSRCVPMSSPTSSAGGRTSGPTSRPNPGTTSSRPIRSRSSPPHSCRRGRRNGRRRWAPRRRSPQRRSPSADDRPDADRPAAVELRVAGWSGAPRRQPPADRHRGRGGRRRARVGDGSPAPDPAGRSGVAEPARAVHHARLAGRCHRADPARRPRLAGVPPPSGRARRRRRHARRVVERAGDLWPRARLVRRRVRRARHRLPVPSRTVRPARGRTAPAAR